MTTTNDIVLHSGVNCGYAELCDNDNRVYYVGLTGNKINDIDEADTQRAQIRHVHFADKASNSIHSDYDSRPLQRKAHITHSDEDRKHT